MHFSCFPKRSNNLLPTQGIEGEFWPTYVLTTSRLRRTPPKISFVNFKGRVAYVIGILTVHLFELQSRGEILCHLFHCVSQAVPLFFAEKEGDEVPAPEGVKSHKTPILSQYLQVGKRNIIMKLTNKPELKTIRQSLRTNGTPAEATLWRILKNKQFDGWRWRRQHSIGNIILDFYCPKAKLGIELDGNHHFSSGGQIADDIKTEILHDFGIKVIHIENNQLWKMPDAILELIKQELESK